MADRAQKLAGGAGVDLRPSPSPITLTDTMGSSQSKSASSSTIAIPSASSAKPDASARKCITYPLGCFGTTSTESLSHSHHSGEKTLTPSSTREDSKSSGGYDWHPPMYAGVSTLHIGKPQSTHPRSAAYDAFLKDYPEFRLTWTIDALRQSEYARLDRTGEVYGAFVWHFWPFSS
jgi:hypothetical protein